ncbi:hypothetical protein L227DRAFT_358299 [Lentinus tigrinus ALCF2SS1-6]|uniref:hydroxymethylglutaryl-CoA reductase (NADPH) n=1 Tax=Lentinus tigrinus ALCF2SS1-6 TaxID=1328759 RepID=A0A5C2SJ43_9APHY|nr:hypothetical protein L227DRAFT_358299 [Lentinus tigrinus ALCF2SS1-6]
MQRMNARVALWGGAQRTIAVSFAFSVSPSNPRAMYAGCIMSADCQLILAIVWTSRRARNTHWAVHDTIQRGVGAVGGGTALCHGTSLDSREHRGV